MDGNGNYLLFNVDIMMDENGHYILYNLGITVYDNWKWVLFIIIFWHYRLWEMEWGKFYTDSIWDYNGCYTVYGLENHLEMRGSKQ